MARQMAELTGGPSSGRLGRLWRRLVSPNDTDESERNAGPVEVEETQPITDCEDRAKVVVCGRIAAVTQAPTCDRPNLVIEVRDSSGAIAVTWIGRRSISGIDTGKGVRLHGRVSCRDGHRTMYNPRYELLD